MTLYEYVVVRDWINDDDDERVEILSPGVELMLAEDAEKVKMEAARKYSQHAVNELEVIVVPFGDA